MDQNYLVICVDADIYQTINDWQNIVGQFRNVVNNVKIFTERAYCVEFLNQIYDKKAFVIAEGSLGQHLVPDIHAMPQLDAIYIFCGNKSGHEQWTKKWSKIKSVHTKIDSICEALQLAVKQSNQATIPTSFATVSEGASNQNLNQLEPTFMYTRIFKEILLEMENTEQQIQDFVMYCRKLYDDNSTELDIITEFEQGYRPELAIWWYTRMCFTSHMLVRALLTLEAGTIISMGFFICDLHKQIQQLHKQQVSSYHGKSLIVYQGQGLSKTDFEEFLKTKGGLMSFNSFLLTSKNRDVSLSFAKDVLTKTDMVGVLFVMTIDLSVSSVPFAAIRDVSYSKAEEEILFSTHTVFRTGAIKQIDNNTRFYQVELQLTADDDEQVRSLTDRIRVENVGATGWRRLGNLLLKIGQFDMAEELYKGLCKQTDDESEKAIYYNQLGYIKNNQGDYEKAVSYYEKALSIKEQTLPPNYLSLAISYNNIGSVYDDMGDYQKTLLFYRKALKMLRKTLRPNSAHFATSYNNIGLVYKIIKEYSNALSFYETALLIRQKTLPSNHPDLATSYNNIGWVFRSTGDYSKALSYFESALAIRLCALPANHPSIQDVKQSIDFVKKQL
jgi:tetratricopeptide (TPR) repeat protein